MPSWRTEPRNRYACIYVGKHGLDQHDGTSEHSPKLTIGGAVTEAAARIAAGANHARVEVLDGESYVEDVTVSAGIRVHAPAAQLVGAVTLEGNATFEIATHYAAADTVGMVWKSGAGIAAYYCRYVMDTRGLSGDLTGIVGCVNATSGGVLHAEGRVMYVGESSSGITDTASGFGHTHFRFNDIYLAGDGAIGMSTLFGNTDLIGYVDHILETGSPDNTVGIMLSTASTTVQLTASEIVADTAYSITNGDLYLQCPKITGTQTGVPVSLSSGVGQGTASPVSSVAPSHIGQVYVDTNGGDVYIATGLTNTDWIQVATP